MPAGSDRPYQSDHEQRALLIDGIMRTMFPKLSRGDSVYADAHRYASRVTDALLEVQDAYNRSKHSGVDRAEISVSTMNVLMICTGRLHGMDNLAFPGDITPPGGWNAGRE